LVLRKRKKTQRIVLLLLVCLFVCCCSFMASQVARKACAPCIASKVACDHQRPCQRCIKHSSPEACVDVPRKQRPLKRFRINTSDEDSPPSNEGASEGDQLRELMAQPLSDIDIGFLLDHADDPAFQEHYLNIVEQNNLPAPSQTIPAKSVDMNPSNASHINNSMNNNNINDNINLPLNTSHDNNNYSNNNGNGNGNGNGNSTMISNYFVNNTAQAFCALDELEKIKDSLKNLSNLFVPSSPIATAGNLYSSLTESAPPFSALTPAASPSGWFRTVSPIPTVLVNSADFAVVDCNLSFVQIIGYSSTNEFFERFSNTPYMPDMLHPALVPFMQKCWKDARSASITAAEFSGVLKTKSGAYVGLVLHMDVGTKTRVGRVMHILKEIPEFLTRKIHLFYRDPLPDEYWEKSPVFTSLPPLAQMSIDSI